MEMKNAPLVHETTSKVKSLRKVAITVAVVALTVCGVAVGMVAAGMENKTVPTLKYTVGTKSTYNHAVSVTQKSGANSYESGLAVEQYVLSVDAAGATTFLVTVPATMGAGINNINMPSAEDSEEAKQDYRTPLASFVVTQNADGSVDWGSVKSDLESESDLFAAASKTLVQHMEAISPRLAADATISETDTFMGKNVDAKYTVNNLEEGTTEVVRTVSPASVQNQVNGPQLGAAGNSVITVKNGEVVAAKSTKATEISTVFEKTGANDGTVGNYKDSREGFTTTTTVNKGVTEAFDLQSFAKALLKYQSVDMSGVLETTVEVRAPHIVNNGFSSDNMLVGADFEADEEATEERSLLSINCYLTGSCNYNATPPPATPAPVTAGPESVEGDEGAGDSDWDWGYKINLGAGGDCQNKMGTAAKKICSNKVGFTIELKIEHSDLLGCKIGLSAEIFLGRTFGVTPANIARITFKLHVYVSAAWNIIIQLYRAQLGAGPNTQPVNNKLGPKCHTPLVPVPGISIGNFGMNWRAGFNVGFDWDAKIELWTPRGSGDWGCLKSRASNQSNGWNDRRSSNNGTAQSGSSNDAKYGNLPAGTRQWLNQGLSLTILGVTFGGKRYVKLNNSFYTKTGCTRTYGNGMNRMKFALTFTPYLELWGEVLFSTGCVLRALRTRFGIRITGRLFSFSLKFVVYLVNINYNCVMMAYAINGMTFTIMPFWQVDYKYNCRKTKWLFRTLLAQFTISWTTPQSYNVHLMFSNNNWFMYPCASTAAETCSSFSSTATYERMVIYLGHCRNDIYMLEHYWGGSKKYM